jgi:hypothetical protein
MLPYIGRLLLYYETTGKGSQIYALVDSSKNHPCMILRASKIWQKF